MKLQVFINVNILTQLFYITLKKLIDKHLKNEKNTSKGNIVKIYYENQIYSNTRIDERNIKGIIKQKQNALMITIELI